MRRRLLGTLIGLPVLSACRRQEAAPGAARLPLPELRTSTPSDVLRSYWARLDWYGAHFVVGREVGGERSHEGIEALRAAMEPLVGEAVMNSFSVRPPSVERLKATIESRQDIDAQTIDLVGHLTNPLASHAVTLSPSPIELFHGESYGGLFRYRLVRGATTAPGPAGNASGWRVSEVWRLEPDAEPHRIR